jgi:hypothetical protein
MPISSEWDAVAAANLTVADQDMPGEGVIPFDCTTVPGTQHGGVPDALAGLDASPEGGLFAGEIPADSDTVQIA